MELSNKTVRPKMIRPWDEVIRDRKFLGILKKDRTWLKYELHCNVKTLAPLFFQNNLNFCDSNVNKCLPALLLALSFSFSQYLGLCVFFNLLPVIKLIKDHWHGSRHISVIINETYKFNLQWLQLVQWFLRRRLKCEMLTDGWRTKSDDNSSRWAKNGAFDSQPKVIFAKHYIQKKWIPIIQQYLLLTYELLIQIWQILFVFYYVEQRNHILIQN
jgi:hypothetical protein